MFTRDFFCAPLTAGFPDAACAGRDDQVGGVTAVVVPADPEAGVRTQRGEQQEQQG